MLAKTYDKQTAKFLAVVGENMPALSGDVMQWWIQNPKAVQKALGTAFCPPEAASAVSAKKPAIISIDRAIPFDPVQLFGHGRTIDEQDERSLALTQIDLSKVQLVSMLEGGERWIKGEEKLFRLKKAGHVRLDAKIFETLWTDQSLIPDSWKKKTNRGSTKFIFFDGTILRDPYGDRIILCLYWHEGRWCWRHHWLKSGWDAGTLSAVLASI